MNMEDFDEEMWREKLNNVYDKKGVSISEEEIQSFMQRVDKVETILSKMRSNDSETVKLGMAQADEMLASSLDGVDINEDQIRIKADKSVINKDAFKSEPDQQTLEMEAFKKSVEVDANRRAEERRQRKEVAERHKIQGNNAFRSGDYCKALLCYDKALDEVKDSCLLYTNRALTYLRLELPDKALEDAEKALKLKESSLKALLYKAQALHLLGKTSEASDTVATALEKHSLHKEYIIEYTRNWSKDQSKTVESKQ